MVSRSPSAKRSSEQGLTILECLIAVAVLGLTVGLVLPPLVIASATRVQTRRAEQALQLAQGEVDRIRVLVERSQHQVASLPATIPTNRTDLENFGAPTGTLNQLKSPSACNRYTGQRLNVNQALMIDVDGDCNADFMMQVFRTPDLPGSTISQTEANLGQQGRPSDFRVGVRVYSIAAGRGNATQAYRTPGQALTGLLTEPASLSLTSGEQNQLRRPLAVLYTRMSWGDQDGTLCGYHGQRDAIDSCQDALN
ncbi:hypothetical protein C7B61_09915 [filamentous cyanobacterium CCP1]|nr:hypothetical protein C7B76_03145 [filamentous cyanobacterium CCP2]PSB66722.1 hypothetical protein C7B61_09915 [filamentous cyanobacterium CCP1]